MLKLLKNFRKKEWILAGISLALIILQVWMDLTIFNFSTT